MLEYKFGAVRWAKKLVIDAIKRCFFQKVSYGYVPSQGQLHVGWEMW